MSPFVASRLRTLSRVAVITTLLLVVGLFISLSTVSARKSPTTALVLVAPSQVALNEPIEVVVMAKDAVNLGGYQTHFLFDTNAAEYGGLTQRENSVVQQGRDIQPVGAQETPDGVVFGFYSCPATTCLDDGSERRWTETGVRGDVELSRITILPHQEGLLDLKLADVQVVDATGRVISVDLRGAAITVKVGNSDTRLPVPAHDATLPATTTASRETAQDVDFSRDGWVSHADAAEVAMTWEDLYLIQSRGCNVAVDVRFDINRDGCLTVADMQTIAARFSRDIPSVQSREASAVNATFVVNSVGDEPDWVWANGDCATQFNTCTLRAAIGEAKANPGNYTILFDIPGGGPHTIVLTKSLPTLSRTDTTILIDGYSQPGSSANTDPLISNAVIKVQIEGNGPNGFHPFQITGSGNTIRGLAVYKFNRGFYLYGASARDNVIVGNFIGTNAAATYNTPSGSGRPNGIHLEQGANHNQFGNVANADRNVISGTARCGIGSWHEGNDYNVIYNNIVGLSPDGTRRLPNKQHGIDINYGGGYNIIGGLEPGMRNVVSGNDSTGIELSHERRTRDNKVVGNYVGTDVTGHAQSYTYNSLYGIVVKDRAYNNYVAYNVVGTNRNGGISIDNYFTCCIEANRFEHNWVGIAPDGSNIANRSWGVQIKGPDSTFGPGNIVAYNPTGLRIEGEETNDRNVITQNSFFANTGMGIDITPIGSVNANDANDADMGPNDQLNYPVISTATIFQVAGTACAGCVVEAFIADGGTGVYGEGKTYLGSGTADGSGNFTILVTGVTTGQYVTTTARDGVGNTSEFSLNKQVTNGAPPVIPPVTFNPVADAYVLASNPTVNYGAEWRLGVAASPDRDSYLRFNVSGLNYPVTHAVLRLHPFDSSAAGFSVHPVTDNSWTEAGITYATEPSIGTAFATSGAVTANTWIEVDVTSLITGNGTYNLALTSGGGLLRFVSREGTNPPQLVIQMAIPPLQ